MPVGVADAVGDGESDGLAAAEGGGRRRRETHHGGEECAQRALAACLARVRGRAANGGRARVERHPDGVPHRPGQGDHDPHHEEQRLGGQDRARGEVPVARGRFTCADREERGKRDSGDARCEVESSAEEQEEDRCRAERDEAREEEPRIKPAPSGDRRWPWHRRRCVRSARDSARGGIVREHAPSRSGRADRRARGLRAVG